MNEANEQPKPVLSDTTDWPAFSPDTDGEIPYGMALSDSGRSEKPWIKEGGEAIFSDFSEYGNSIPSVPPVEHASDMQAELNRLIDAAATCQREYREELRRKDEDGGEWYWLSAADKLASFIIAHRAIIQVATPGEYAEYLDEQRMIVTDAQAITTYLESERQRERINILETMISQYQDQIQRTTDLSVIDTLRDSVVDMEKALVQERMGIPSTLDGNAIPNWAYLPAPVPQNEVGQDNPSFATRTLHSYLRSQGVIR